MSTLKRSVRNYLPYFQRPLYTLEMLHKAAGLSPGQILGRLLIVAGLLMIAYFYGTGVYTYFVQRDLRSQWRSLETVAAELESGKPNGAGELIAGDVFGRLRIPKLELDVIVLEGTDRGTLTKGPGRIKGTAAPETGGNTAVSGHRTTFGAPFAQLDRLRKGDRLELTTARGKFTYLVAGSAVVKPTDVAVVGQDFKNRLTLTTCDPPGSAVRRLAVWGLRE